MMFLCTNTIVYKSIAQCGTGEINTASDHDEYGGVYDTLCAGGCQRYWVKNADCPYFKDIGFHWRFYGKGKSDTLVGDTVYYCFPDTGTFFMDIYASNFNLDSAYNLNARNIILPCPPVVNFKANRQTICTNECVQFTDHSTRLANQWEWQFEGGEPPAYTGKNPPPVCYKDTGRFTVFLRVYNPYGSTDLQQTQYISVQPGPEPVAVQQSFFIKEGDILTLHSCARGVAYQWQPPVAILEQTDTTLLIQPEKTVVYQHTVATPNGCKSTCYYDVKVQSGLLLPTGFSPNGDGVNDVFRILNDNITLQSFAIYNRWGERVFFTTNQTDGWDGVYKDMAQPMDTYVWYAEYVVTKSGKQKSAKGNVTLVR